MQLADPSLIPQCLDMRDVTNTVRGQHSCDPKSRTTSFIHSKFFLKLKSAAGQTVVTGIPRHRISLRLSHIAVRTLSVSILGRRASLRPSGRHTFFVETSVLGVPRHRISLRLCQVAIRTFGRRLPGGCRLALAHKVRRCRQSQRQSCSCNEEFFHLCPPSHL
jgi:hypothetical protein